jgi:hypothetical protein
MQVVDVNGNMFGYDFLEIIGIDGKPKTPGGGGGPYVPYTGATGNVDLGEYELKAGQLELDQTPTGTAGVAVMRWNDQDGTADLGLKGGNVTLQIGQEEVVRVVNKVGVNLLEANYQCVRVRTQAEGGAAGQRLAVKLAQANSKANHTGILGLVTETINNNQEGFITTFGEVREINTTGSLQGETWLDGDVLWLSETTAGQLTNIEPNTHPVQIGYVVYAHANHGKIFVSVSEGVDQLNELHDVAITSVANNDILQYDSATSLWKNESLSAAGIQPTITLTTTGTSGAATLVGATLNVPQYSGGGGTSPFTKLAIGTTGTIVTGTTTNTITQSILIPANTLAADNTLDIIARFTKTGTAGGGNYRMYINTTNSLTGATLIASFYTIAGGASIPTHQNFRTFFYNGTNLTNNLAATSANTSDMIQLTIPQTSVVYVSTVAYYLIFAIQLTNIADSSVINGYRITKYA